MEFQWYIQDYNKKIKQRQRDIYNLAALIKTTENFPSFDEFFNPGKEIPELEESIEEIQESFARAGLKPPASDAFQDD